MDKRTENPSLDKMTLGQKLSFGVGEFGTTLVYSAIAFYLMVYYTDVAMISAAAAGIIVMIARISDAITDPIMGIIADRTHSRWGRYRPYILFFALPFVVMGVLCFSIPNISQVGKTIYALITYIILGIFYTTVDIPYWSLISAVSNNPQERSEISAIKRFSGMFNNLLIAVLFLPVVAMLGKGNQAVGYQRIMIIIAIIGVLALWFTFLRTKEKVVIRENVKTSVKDSFKTVFKNKPLLMVLFTAIFLSTSYNMKMTATIYYFNYNVGRPDLIPAFLGLTGLCVLAGILLSIPVAKALGKRNAILLGLFLSNIGYLGMFITGPSQIVMMFVWNTMGTVAFGMPLVIYISMIADTVDYAEWKTGIRSDSFIFSMNTFTYKLTSGLGIATVGLVLTIYGYIPNVSQTTHTLLGINLLMTIVPFVGGVIAMIPMFLYNLSEKKMSAILSELKEKRQGDIPIHAVE